MKKFYFSILIILITSFFGWLIFNVSEISFNKKQINPWSFSFNYKEHKNISQENFINYFSKKYKENGIENVLENIEKVLASFVFAENNDLYWICSDDGRIYYNEKICQQNCLFYPCIKRKETTKTNLSDLSSQSLQLLPQKAISSSVYSANYSSYTYSANYYGSCNGLYCYNGPGGHHVCGGYEMAMREGMASLTTWRYEVLYQKNRMISEKQDLLLEIDRLKLEIEYYQKQIEAEKNILEKNPNAKEYHQSIIDAFEEKKKEAEKEKELREKLLPHFDELATKEKNSLLDKLAETVKGAVEQIEKCLIEGVKECKPSCSGGCHDTLGCFPVACSGGRPKVCGLGTHYSQAFFISKSIFSEVNKILKILGAKPLAVDDYIAPTPTTTPATTTDKEVREELKTAGINVNKVCKDSNLCDLYGKPISQTCLNGLQPTTIEGLKTIKKNCNCDVTVTAGTECGHASGNYSHENGYKVDLRPNKNLDKYIEEKGCSKTKYVICKGTDGNIYYYEGDHWDVCFSCPI